MRLRVGRDKRRGEKTAEEVIGAEARGVRQKDGTFAVFAWSFGLCLWGFAFLAMLGIVHVPDPLAVFGTLAGWGLLSVVTVALLLPFINLNKGATLLIEEALSMADGVKVRVTDVLRHGERRSRTVDVSWDDLAASLELRTTLRSRFGLKIDLGDDSPEHVGPSDAALAFWEHATELPVTEKPDDAYRSLPASAFGLSMKASDALAVTKARREADLATTVVDEAVLVGNVLTVREGSDFGAMDVSLLQGERPFGEHGVNFVFGKSTKVVFVDAENDVVARLHVILDELVQERREVAQSASEGAS